MRQTVFTPTYNRASLLPRLYDSLKRQTFNDFCWLIIDDGSTDSTQEIIDKFKSEHIINIEYFRKDNGGKFSAQWLAYHLAKTPYITEVDSDDYLCPDSIRIFEQNWIEIENSCLPIAKISMFTTDINGNYRGNGNYSLPKHIQYIDRTWHQLVLKECCHRELINSLSVEKFLYSFNIENYTWNIGKFLDESIIWSAIGRKFETRLINNIGLIVHTDATNSILRQGTSVGNKSEKSKNICANSIYFIDENIDYFNWNPRYFIGHYKRLIINAKRSGLDSSTIISHFKSKKAKVLFHILNLIFKII